MAQLGWKAGPEQYPPDELLNYAIIAEQAGFDSIDVSDHFAPWSEAGQACFSWTWLGAVAARTSTIHLGTGITCPTLRYHPAIVAQAAATVEYLAPGRVYLGVGTGEALNEYASTGLWPEYDERQERMAEAIDLIRALWSGEEVTHRGTYYQTRKAKLWTRSGRPIPLYVSALVPPSARFAGRYGDGLFTVGGQPPELYRQLLRAFEEGAREAGKDASSMPKLIELNVAYTDDEQAAIRCMKEYWAGTFIPALFDQKIYTPRDSARNGESVGSDVIKGKMCLSPEVDAHVRYAQQHIDLGFTHLFFHCAGPDQPSFLERYGRDVLPKIRQGVTAAV
ncbi:MAG: TIGR03557 family F420-dependent LLM class oxidoreductase [Chloroflexi bacterium]|nr:TIGR03557 family F420-dependent LLM class oxidoreductase [Chloroflexota bacterium]